MMMRAALSKLLFLLTSVSFKISMRRLFQKIVHFTENLQKSFFSENYVKATGCILRCSYIFSQVVLIRKFRFLEFYFDFHGKINDVGT